MAAILDLLVKLDGVQIIAIVFATTISGILLCTVLAKSLSGSVRYICKMTASFLNFPLKLYAIYTNYNLRKNGKEIIQYRITNDELFMDDGKSNLSHLSTSENLSDGDDLSPDDDELEHDKTIMDFSRAFYALKNNFKQHDNKKDK